jgi:cytochrome c oxidase subunit 3
VGFLTHLTDKPWLTGSGEVLRQDDMIALPKAKFALRVLIAVIAVLFTLLVIAYSERMEFGGDWRPLYEPWVLWLNTAALVLSSAGLHWASLSAKRGRMDGVRKGLLAGGVCAFAFLAGQLLAYRELVELGYYASSNPANAFFYLITAMHGLHLMGGLVAWGRTMDKVRRGVEVAKVRMSVELCATYWHFLLLVWAVLFTLLLLT